MHLKCELQFGGGFRLIIYLVHFVLCIRCFFNVFPFLFTSEDHLVCSRFFIVYHAREAFGLEKVYKKDEKKRKENGEHKQM